MMVDPQKKRKRRLLWGGKNLARTFIIFPQFSMFISAAVQRFRGGMRALYGSYNFKRISGGSALLGKISTARNNLFVGRFLSTHKKVTGARTKECWSDILEDMRSFMPNQQIAAVSQENELRIIPKVNKLVGLNDKRIALDLQKYKSVELDDKIDKAICDIKTVFGLSHHDRAKGPLVVVRGIGGGKTLAMVSLQRRLRMEKGVLPVLITFNSAWTPDGEFGTFKDFFPVTRHSAGQTMALVIVSRVISVHFGVPYDNVVDSLVKAEEKLRLAVGRMKGRDITADFLAFLANMEGAEDVVLLVDETVAAEREFFKQFPSDTRGVGHIRDALLNVDYGALGLRSALVLSGLKPHISGRTQSSREMIPFVLSERLDPDVVVSALFLTDLDTDGCLHPIHLDCGSPEDGRRVLNLVASVLNSLPRGLELAQDEIRRRVQRESGHRKLAVTSQLVDEIFSGTLENFKMRYPELASHGLPDPDLLYALLYGTSVPLDDRVAVDIARSVFVNSLERHHFGDVNTKDKPVLIELKSSIVSLGAALPPQMEIEDPVVQSLRDLLALTRQWVSAPLAAGFMLESLSVAWMRLKLTVARQNDMKGVPLLDLLRLKIVEVVETADPILDSFLADEVPTPPKFDSFRARQLTQSFYDQHGQPNVAVIDELDKIGRLTAEKPCVLIKSADGDCFDYALGFLGKCDNSGQRPHRLIMFDNKSVKELEPNLEAVLPADFTLVQTKTHKPAGYQSQHVKKTAAAWRNEERNKGATAHLGLGSAVGSGEYMYVYQTTMEGESYAVGNVLTLGRVDTEQYFGFMYPPYAAKRASFDAAWKLSRSEKRNKK